MSCSFYVFGQGDLKLLLVASQQDLVQSDAKTFAELAPDSVIYLEVAGFHDALLLPMLHDASHSRAFQQIAEFIHQLLKGWPWFVKVLHRSNVQPGIQSMYSIYCSHLLTRRSGGCPSTSFWQLPARAHELWRLPQLHLEHPYLICRESQHTLVKTVRVASPISTFDDYEFWGQGHSFPT